MTNDGSHLIVIPLGLAFIAVGLLIYFDKDKQ